MRASSNKAFLSLILFLISPFLSLPVILHEIYERRKYALIVFSAFVGILCYLYLPSVLQDGARRYLLYENLKMYNSFSEFYDGYLQHRADYVFYSLIYFFSAFDIKFQILLFLLGFFNAYVPLYIFSELAKKWFIQKHTYFKMFLLVLCTYSFTFLFSGVRNNVAFSFVFLSFYLFYFKNMRFIPLLLYVLGLMTHFSLIVYLPILLLFKYVNTKYLFIVFAGVTILLFVIPPTQIQSLFMSTDVGNEMYNDKIEAYSNTKQGTVDSTAATLFAKTLFSAWFYVALIYLFITNKYKRNQKFLNLTIAFVLPVVLFIAFPGISNRYMFGAKFFFVLLLISDSLYFNNKKWQNIFILLFLIQPLYDVTRLLTESFIAGYFKLENISLVTILMQTYTYQDMLPPY